jgi:hypothetical protein
MERGKKAGWEVFTGTSVEIRLPLGWSDLGRSEPDPVVGRSAVDGKVPRDPASAAKTSSNPALEAAGRGGVRPRILQRRLRRLPQPPSQTPVEIQQSAGRSQRAGAEGSGVGSRDLAAPGLGGSRSRRRPAAGPVAAAAESPSQSPSLCLEHLQDRP